MFVCDIQLTVFIPKDFAKTIARANESYTFSFSSKQRWTHICYWSHLKSRDQSHDIAVHFQCMCI